MRIINKKEIIKSNDSEELQNSKETKFIVTAFYKGEKPYIEKVINLIKQETEKIFNN